ncbi:MAG: TonB-dependent receptor [Alphaproteobacteria bacterium]|nr:TonB-dependent receptor [Alphaproteobacteria bacterium]MDE2163037.1 TonB-dependent receptor [Alphaproteobacteria bacterium]MDE2266424.1 TonB-dependent receptor [Alphaproteobacteria bacterium]MDE2499932.1 TonB-dependent receptor [Alphaproteobacteria bacterium]
MRLKGILAGSASVLAIIAVGVPAVAQSDAGIETVVVTGIRASLDRAIDIKRSSTAIVDAVSAEDIGKFPDKNVADALQRVPGVNTVSAASGEGGFDENDRVSIRGTNASLTQTLVDGHSIANGDWFILDQFQTIGRSVSYTLLPSEIVSTAKVYKSQQADLVEGGVAGVVDIQTRKPLDFKDDFTLEASAEAAYTTLRSKTTPQFNALVGWKDPSGKFGVMLQAFYEQRDIRRDGQEFLGYSSVTAASPAGTAHPDLVGAEYPTLIGSALFLQQRTRKGGDLTVQFRPSDSFELTLSGFYAHLNASNINNNYMFWGTNEFGGNVPTNYKVVNNTVVSATFPSAGGTPIVADSIMRPGSGAETYYLNADGTWNPNDNLTMSFKTGYSHGVGKTNPQVAWEGEVQGAPGGTAGYDFTTGVAAVSVPGVNTADASTLVNDWAWTVVNSAVDREYYGQVDAEQQVGIGPIKSVKVGARFADHKRTSIVWDGGVSYGGSIGSQISTSNYPSNFASAFKIPGMLTDVPLGNTAEIENLLFNNTSWRSYPQSPAAISNPKNGRFDWQLSLNVEEQDTAGYAMANIGGENWKGNFGVRVVKTDETINQYVNDPTGTYSDFGSYGINKITHTYWDVLPSANLSIDLSEKSVLRFAAAETMARPDYSALGGSVQLTDLNLTGNGGNPNLKPIKSANYDLSYEWYYAPQSMLSVGLFYMDLSSYVSYGNSTASYVNMTLTGKNPTPIYSTYTITSPFNSSGHDEGVEVNWEQPIYGGFGVQTNFTYANGVDNGGGPLVGDSKETANFTGYYENEWLSARVSYMYRSKMLVGLDRSSAENQNAYGTLNASVQFTVTDNISLTFDGLNLTNQTLKYYAANTTQPRALYSNGSQLYAGVRFKY